MQTKMNKGRVDGAKYFLAKMHLWFGIHYDQCMHFYISRLHVSTCNGTLDVHQDIYKKRAGANQNLGTF